MTSKQYVRAIDVLARKFPSDPERIAREFVFFLRRNRHTGMWRKIARAFEQQRAREDGRQEIEMQVARDFSVEDREALERKTRDVNNAPQAQVIWRKNSSLMGGTRVRIGEKGYDESVERRLRALREHLRKNS